MPSRTQVNWHWFALLIAFILLAALGWQGKQTQQAVLDSNLSVSRSLQIITATQSMLSSLQDIETGARGFVLTGQPAYLEPYEFGLRAIEQRRRELQALLGGRAFPDQHWFAQLDRNIADRLVIAMQPS